MRSGLVLNWIAALKYIKKDLSAIEESDGRYALQERIKLALVLFGGCLAVTACVLSLVILITTTFKRNILKTWANKVESATGISLNQKNVEEFRRSTDSNYQIRVEREKNPRLYNRIFNKSVIVSQHADKIEDNADTKEGRIFLMARYVSTGFRNRDKEDGNGNITWFPEKNLLEGYATDEEKILVASALLVRMGISNIVNLHDDRPQTIQIQNIDVDKYQKEVNEWKISWPEHTEVLQMTSDGNLVLKFSPNSLDEQKTVDMMISMWNQNG